MKRIIVLISLAITVVVYGADVTVPSSWNEEKQAWIGDVDVLTNAISKAVANQKIYLSKGIYDLSPLTNAPMYSAGGGGYGAALLGNFPWVKNVKLIGATGKPEDVVLSVKDSDYRILVLNAPAAALHNVTVTGGNAVSAHINTYNYRRGGGVLLGHADSVVSNCVFYGNKASVAGGAVSGPNGLNGYVYDSVFYGNDCNIAGMAACQTRLYNCTFTNNVSVGEAAKNYGASVTTLCHVYDSYFADNRGNGTGGVDGGSATRCTFVNNRSENLVQNNDASNAGGGGARNAALTNCYFYGNTTYQHGGAVFKGVVVGCTIVSNLVRRALNDIYAYGGGVYGATLVENSTVVSNYSGYGGGVCDCAFVSNTELSCNRAQRGGGASSCALSGCVLAHNVATQYDYNETGGGGGGLYQGSATNCVFRDNYASATAGTEYLKGCDIADSRIDAVVVDSCVLQGISNTQTALAAGNVAYPDGRAITNMYMIGASAKLMRNTLVANCTWRSTPASENCAMFYTALTGSALVENCTFADNWSYYLVRTPNGSSEFYLSFVNCAFVGNRYLSSTACDVSGFDAMHMTLTNCAYGVMSRRTAQAEGVEDSGCFQVARDACRFVGKGDHPYSPRRNSPLCGRGKVSLWMLGGTDIAGKPRLRDGKADIGCYQCGQEQTGMVLFIDGHAFAFDDNATMSEVLTVPHEFDCLVESGHIQGACCSEKAIYLSHSKGIDKIGWDGKLIRHVDVPAHLGDSAYADGLVYGACDIKDASLRVDGKPGLVRVWDEDLNHVADAWFTNSLDGITVLGDTVYVGVAAAGAPHGTNVVKLLRRDLTEKGNVAIDLGYWTKYGVQTMATDGASVFFGNYGADADTGNPDGWNGSRLSPALLPLENLKFPRPNGVSEGFDFVPKRISRRRDPVFMRIGAASSQKEWNTTDHPPQIRIQFFSYKDGIITSITP